MSVLATWPIRSATRAARRHGMLGADEVLDDGRAGLVDSLVRGGRPVELPARRRSIVLGFSDRTLVLVGRPITAAVDLRDVRGVQRCGWSGVGVSWVGDGGTSWLVWSGLGPGWPAESFVRRLAERCDARRPRPEPVGPDELCRHVAKLRFLRIEAAWRRTHPARASVPVHVDALTGSPGETSRGPTDPGGDDAELLWLGDDEFALVDRPRSIRLFTVGDVTSLRVSPIAGSGGACARWELGWRNELGERRALLAIPATSARRPGADEFLRASGLGRRARITGAVQPGQARR